MTNKPLSRNVVNESRGIAQEVLSTEELRRENDKEVHRIADAFRKVLGEGLEGDQSVILMKRIPIICKDIIDIKVSLAKISTNSTWQMRINAAMGTVALAVIVWALTGHIITH